MRLLPLLFLDIDGVLNSWEFAERIREKTECEVGDEFYDEKNSFDPQAVERLNRILEETDCEVVLSSTWRLYHKLWEIKNWLIMNGMKPEFGIRFIGVTPELYTVRGSEIQEWLYKNNANDRIFAIVDDDSDMEHLIDKLVQTDCKIGLQDHDVIMLIKKLKRP